MTEEVEVLELPLHQRIAKLVAQDSLEKILEESNLDVGYCTVELIVHTELPEYTPRNFTPNNDLEDYLHSHKGAGSESITMPFSFKLIDMIRGLQRNVVTLENTYNCGLLTQMDPTGKAHLLLEFISKSLRRSLYVKLTPTAHEAKGVSP